MKIQIEGNEYDITEEVMQAFIQSMRSQFLSKYAALSERYGSIMIGVKSLVRTVIYQMEDKVPDELKSEFRPKRGDDPFLHLFDFIFKYAIEMVKNATINVITDGNGKIVSVSGKPAHKD